jgi:hypothetical protein
LQARRREVSVAEEEEDVKCVGRGELRGVEGQDQEGWWGVEGWRWI